jgi:Zinc finger, C2H2 type
MTTEQPLLLSLEEAAEHLGITPDELIRSRQRGLAPGSYGLKEYPGGPLLWKREDLEAPPSPISQEKEEEMARMVQTIGERQESEPEPDPEPGPEISGASEENLCPVCGKSYKTSSGLTRHIKTHDEEG